MTKSIFVSTTITSNHDDTTRCQAPENLPREFIGHRASPRKLFFNLQSMTQLNISANEREPCIRTKANLGHWVTHYPQCNEWQLGGTYMAMNQQAAIAEFQCFIQQVKSIEFNDFSQISAMQAVIVEDRHSVYVVIHEVILYPAVDLRFLRLRKGVAKQLA